MTKKYCDICGAEIIEPHPMANAYTCGRYPVVSLMIVTSPDSLVCNADLCSACAKRLCDYISALKNGNKEDPE